MLPLTCSATPFSPAIFLVGVLASRLALAVLFFALSVLANLGSPCRTEVGLESHLPHRLYRRRMWNMIFINAVNDCC